MMRARDIPNLITVGRILLVAPTTWALLQQHHQLALTLFLVAGLSDGVDGFLAKHYNWTSHLGALLDPLADKALLVCGYAALTWTGLLPVWLFVLIILRDLVIVTGATVYHFRIARLEADPTRISKLNTLLQILLVLLIILGQVAAWVNPMWTTVLVYVVALTTVWSGLDYVVTWSRRARRA
jgi:cardiolipin synthase